MTIGTASIEVVSGGTGQVTYIGDLDEVVSTPIVSNYIPPEVAALSDGGHVVVWSAYNGNAADSEYGVYQQRYDVGRGQGRHAGTGQYHDVQPPGICRASPPLAPAGW